MSVIKSIPKNVECLALLLFMTANVPLLKVGPVSLSFFVGILVLAIANSKGYIILGKELKSLLFFTLFSLLAIILSPAGLTSTSVFVLLQVIYWFYITVLFRNIGTFLSYRSLSKIVLFIEILFSVVFFLFGEDNPYLSANLSSFLLVTLWPFSFFLANNKFWKLIAILIAVISLFVVGSRTGIIVVFFQLVSIFVVRHLTGKGKLILLVSMLAFAIFVGSQSIRSAVAKSIEPANPDIAILIETPQVVFVLDKSWAQRRIQQEKCKQIFYQHPVIGIGPLNIVNYRININTSNLSDIDDSSFAHEMRNSEKRSSHNSYFQLIAENGMVGTLLLFFFFLYLLKGLYRASLVSDAYAIFFTSLVGLVLNLFMVSALWGTNTWLLFGMYASVIRQSKLTSEFKNK